jgi:hypothetical protein
MTLQDSIRRLSGQPLPRQTLLPLLEKYRNVNDKLHNMVTDGLLVPLRRGLYVAGSEIDGPKPDLALIANHILGPSYVTADTALSYYGLIPERVYAVTSATIRNAAEYTTRAGYFVYRHLPSPYYAFGLTRLQLGEKQYALYATAQKAVWDKVIFTPGLIIRSRRQAREVLLENLRLDESGLQALDWAQTDAWLEYAPKKESCQYILEMLQFV